MLQFFTGRTCEITAGTDAGEGYAASAGASAGEELAVGETPTDEPLVGRPCEYAVAVGETPTDEPLVRRPCEYEYDCVGLYTITFTELGEEEAIVFV